jgi:Fe-S-cluster containining protein
LIDSRAAIPYHDLMDCTRCGKCCFEPFNRHVRPDDLAAWKRAGRADLICAYEAELASHDHTNRAMAEAGLALHTCKHLSREAPGRFACGIYELRPITCREFEVGCSRLCPGYQGKRRRE